jgi:hypothetical protein
LASLEVGVGVGLAEGGAGVGLLHAGADLRRDGGRLLGQRSDLRKPGRDHQVPRQ